MGRLASNFGGVNPAKTQTPNVPVPNIPVPNVPVPNVPARRHSAVLGSS
jgi:hypothetical protein